MASASMHGLPYRALAGDLPETALHATSRHPTPRSPAALSTWAVVWPREVVHGVVNRPRIDGMQGVRGSNPLSSTRHNATHTSALSAPAVVCVALCLVELRGFEP